MCLAANFPTHNEKPVSALSEVDEDDEEDAVNLDGDTLSGLDLGSGPKVLDVTSIDSPPSAFSEVSNMFGGMLALPDLFSASTVTSDVTAQRTGSMGTPL